MPTPVPVTFDSRSLLIAGARTLLISGEVHYARAPRAAWPRLLNRSAACGLNCIATYVFWNYHETARDVYDFSGERDLAHFLRLCSEHNLYVILRAGPYCCAEWNYGGYPPYLRDEPQIVIRTWNRPYLDRVERYFQRLVDQFRPYLASNGGPVVLVQVENEYANVAKRYGEDGSRYLEWMADLATRLGVDVPVIMCEGGSPAAIETVNGYGISDQRIADFRRDHPDRPLLWTELWPGWYDTWGYQIHLRDARNIAFHLLRFVTRGGSGWNYYMWHAGTNFGRTSMYLQATRYGLDAPLDEYGRATPKAAYLAELHHLLADRQSILLNGERVPAPCDEADVTTFRLDGRELTIALDDDKAQVLEAGRVLFDSERDFARLMSRWTPTEWSKAAVLDRWTIRSEPFPSGRGAGIESPQPIEQLSLTHDESDYCWYSAEIEIDSPGQIVLDIPYAADMLSVYLDERLVGRTETPLLEVRGATVPATPGPVANVHESQAADGYRQVFSFDASAGAHRLDILAASLGMIKGDWQVSGSMQTERKGIWQPVTLSGARLGPWTMRPGLEGERRPFTQLEIAGDADRPCTWRETSFMIDASTLAGDTDFRLDAAGLGKGMLILNGHPIGRHWLVIGDGWGKVGGWWDAKRDGVSPGPAGEPTQRYYHLPTAWLLEWNTLLIFEEQSVGNPVLSIESRPASR